MNFKLLILDNHLSRLFDTKFIEHSTHLEYNPAETTSISSFYKHKIPFIIEINRLRKSYTFFGFFDDTYRRIPAHLRPCPSSNNITNWFIEQKLLYDAYQLELLL